MYLEQGPSANLANTEAHNVTMTILFDFWCKVTPCILQLVSHSKVVSFELNFYFLALNYCVSAGRNGEFALFVPAGGSFGVQLYRAQQIAASLVSRSLLAPKSAARTLAGKIVINVFSHCV